MKSLKMTSNLLQNYTSYARLKELALTCVIESMRNNKDKYDYLINRTPVISAATGYGINNNQLSLYEQQLQPHPVSQHNDDVGEIYKSYCWMRPVNSISKLVRRLTNSTISEAAFSI